MVIWKKNQWISKLHDILVCKMLTLKESVTVSSYETVWHIFFVAECLHAPPGKEYILKRGFKLTHPMVKTEVIRLYFNMANDRWC